MKKFLKRIIDVPNWKKKTKVIMVILVLIVIASAILCAMKPEESQMKSQASPEMQKLIQRDENSARKRVTVTYNSLIVVNYCSFSSSGAQVMNERFVGFAGKIYPADQGAAKVVGQLINYTYRLLGCGENLLHGAKLTITLTAISVVIGVILGTFLALGKISKNKVLNKICGAYIFFFRGTPLLIQLFAIYFALPAMFNFAWTGIFSGTEAVSKGSFLAAVIAFSLNSAAYCAEIVRAAIQSIDKGQNEAAKALGMSYGQTMKKIIIPQSIRRMVPPVCNEFVMVLKDASLVFAIALMDITTISNSIMTGEGSYIVFLPALLIYLVITGIFTYIFGKIEARFSIYE